MTGIKVILGVIILITGILIIGAVKFNKQEAQRDQQSAQIVTLHSIEAKDVNEFRHTASMHFLDELAEHEEHASCSAKGLKASSCGL